MFTVDEIDRIMTFVRFNYENTSPVDNDFIKSTADLWLNFPSRKFHEMMRVSASKVIENYGLDKI